MYVLQNNLILFSFEGTKRTLPNGKFPQIAEQLKNHKIEVRNKRNLRFFFHNIRTSTLRYLLYFIVSGAYGCWRV